jgi:hypothetical protein
LAVTTATDFGVSKPTTAAGGVGTAPEDPLLQPRALDMITARSMQTWIFMNSTPAENDFAALR